MLVMMTYWILILMENRFVTNKNYVIAAQTLYCTLQKLEKNRK